MFRVIVGSILGLVIAGPALGGQDGRDRFPAEQDLGAQQRGRGQLETGDRGGARRGGSPHQGDGGAHGRGKSAN